MDLQQRLNKFRKQQEKCQADLASLTPRAVPSKSHQTQRATPPSTFLAPTKSPGAVKFSNDTERLQRIKKIRDSAPGLQIKLVIDLLLETREAFTPEQINEACYVDLNRRKDVFDSLRNNPKVNYDGKHFSYKAKHDLKGKDQLLSLIRKFPEGLAVEDVKDSYSLVMQDLETLKASGQVWLLSSLDSKEDIVYPNDPKVMKIEVDDDLKQLFRGIELPRDMLDIEKELQKNGMKPATNTARRRATIYSQGITSKPKTKKKREISKRTKLSNFHMPELFT